MLQRNCLLENVVTSKTLGILDFHVAVNSHYAAYQYSI